MTVLEEMCIKYYTYILFNGVLQGILQFGISISYGSAQLRVEASAIGFLANSNETTI